MSESDAPTAASTKSGAILKDAREKLGLTADDVATELRLSTSQINALENDDYSELPGPTYVRGYLRSYARLVKIDEESVLPAITHSGVGQTSAVARPIHRSTFTILCTPVTTRFRLD